MEVFTDKSAPCVTVWHNSSEPCVGKSKPWDRLAYLFLRFVILILFYCREVRDDLSGGDVETTFRRLCPPALTDRKTAAIKFSALLGI